MTLTESEAAAALASIEAAETRSSQLERYRRASPYLLLWGAIWLAGFTADDLLPAYARQIWRGLILFGLAAQLWLAFTRTRTHSAARKRSVQSLAVSGLAALFGFGVVYLMQARDQHAVLAFSGLLTGTIYAAIGVFAGVRFLVTGLAMIGLTFTGYALLSAHYALWMAMICGGGLMLAGLWLRRV